MQIIVELPEDLLQHHDPPREALEALAVAGYQFSILSSDQTCALLGFKAHHELKTLLKERGIWDRGLDVESLDSDAEWLELPGAD